MTSSAPIETPAQKKIHFVVDDGTVVEADLAAATKMCRAVHDSLSAGGSDGASDVNDSTTTFAVPVPRLHVDDLRAVVKFIERRANEPLLKEAMAPEPNSSEDRAMLHSRTLSAALVPLLVAADHLDCAPLFEMVKNELRRRVKDKAPEQLRVDFALPDNLTAEQKQHNASQAFWTRDR
jgi:hypothetical protein